MPEQKNRGTLIDIASLEDSVGAKGANFDPEVLYDFTVQSMETRKLKKQDAEGHDGKEFTVIDLSCVEGESEVAIRQSFFYNKKVIVNDEDKTKEGDAVKFARGIGYDVGVDKPFKWKDIFRVGLKFKAHVKEQLDRKTKAPTGYSEIDLMTVQPAKGGSAKTGAKQAPLGNQDDIDTIVAMAPGYANKTALIKGLNEAGMGKSINLAIQLDGAGKLTYSA
jgi:hypothetical protein